MRTEPACIPCFLRGAEATAHLLGLDARAGAAYARAVGGLAARHPAGDCPPRLGQQVQRALRSFAGVDPYRAIKAASNALAWRLLPECLRAVEAAADPFAAALRFSIAGNCIDFGTGVAIGEEQVRTTLARLAATDLDPAAVEAARRSCRAARRIVMLADNAGELVLDRLLLAQLAGAELTVVVRGGPVINDATLADAEAARIGEFATVIASGSDAPGTILADLAPAAAAAVRTADLVIAKGQGNWESWEGGPVDCLHLLLVKCAVVAAQTGLPVGAPALILRPGAAAEAG